MNPIYVSDAVHWMTAVLLWLVAVPAYVVLAAAYLIPGTPRPAPDYDSRGNRPDITGSFLLDRPGLDRPQRTDVVIDPAARARRVDRAAQALVRRREGLHRQRTVALGLLDAIDHQLLAISDAETGPTPVVRDEQPTGGER